MALSKDDVLNAVAEMSVLDLVELIKDMEEKFGVTATAAMAAPAVVAAPPEGEAVAEEQSEFDVVLGLFVLAGPLLAPLIFPQAPPAVAIVGGLAFGLFAAICAVPQKFL